MDARLDELKKAILDLSFSTQGRSVETTDASSGSRESHVRAEAEHRSCSTDLNPTDCNLSPMQKTEEHKVRGIDSESYFLSFSHDSMNTIVGNSIGLSELSTMGDDSLIEQHSNIVEEESTMSLKDAIAIYVEEFVNSRNSSMKFDFAARASFDVKAEGLVDEEEKEVSKEVSMGESLCRCKGVDGKYVQMDRTFDAFLFLDPIKVPVSSQIELAKVPMTNKMRVQNPSKCGWSVPNWFAMPKVKMKTEKVGLGNLITASTQEFGEGIQLVDDAFVFLKGKITRVIVADSFFFHFGVDTGAGEILDHGKVNGIELEQYVIALFDNKTFSQAKETKETKSLPIARRNASLRELAVTLNVVRNLTRLRVRYPKPFVKMKFMVVPVDSCRVFKGGGMTRVTHMQVQYGEEIGGKLEKQFDLDKGRLQRVTRRLCADDCDGNLKFADDAVIQTLCGLSKTMKEPNVSSSPLLQSQILWLSDGVLEVLFTSGDIYLGGVTNRVLIVCVSWLLIDVVVVLIVELLCRLRCGLCVGVIELAIVVVGVLEELGCFFASSPEHVIPVVDSFGNVTNSDNIIHNKVRLKLIELSQELHLKGASKTPYCQFAGGLTMSIPAYLYCATSLLEAGNFYIAMDMQVLEQVGTDTNDL